MFARQWHVGIKTKSDASCHGGSKRPREHVGLQIRVWAGSLDERLADESDRFRRCICSGLALCKHRRGACEHHHREHTGNDATSHARPNSPLCACPQTQMDRPKKADALRFAAGCSGSMGLAGAGLRVSRQFHFPAPSSSLLRELTRHKLIPTKLKTTSENQGMFNLTEFDCKVNQWKPSNGSRRSSAPDIFHFERLHP